MMLAVVLALALLIGVTLGLLGGGGSILAVPILVYVAGQDPKAAIAMSLLVVGVTSAVGAIAHARAGRVQWRTGLVFGVAGMAGAYGGGRLAAFIPGDVLLIAFGLMMAATAIAMLRGRSAPPSDGHVAGPLPLGRIILEGSVVGVVTGLVGAGGGFLVVPALVLLGGLPMSVAVGTSLVVIALKSGAGLLGYLASTPIDWPLALAVTGAAVAGSLLGGLLTGRIPEARLRRAFGWFVIVMAIFVLGQQLPSGAFAGVAAAPEIAIPVIVGIGLVAGVLAVVRRRRRTAARPARPPDGGAAPRNVRTTS
jgi:uncharacterized protein